MKPRQLPRGRRTGDDAHASGPVTDAQARRRPDAQPAESLARDGAERERRARVRIELAGIGGAELVRAGEALQRDVTPHRGLALRSHASLDGRELVVGRRRARLDVQLIAVRDPGARRAVLVPDREATGRLAAVVHADDRSLAIRIPECPQPVGHRARPVIHVVAVRVQRAVRVPGGERTLDTARHRGGMRLAERRLVRPARHRQLAERRVGDRAPLRAALRLLRRHQLRARRTRRGRHRASRGQRDARGPHTHA